MSAREAYTTKTLYYIIFLLFLTHRNKYIETNDLRQPARATQR